MKEPKDHPNPDRWWNHILCQSWIALLGMVIQAPFLIIFGIPSAATAPLVIINIGLVAANATYGGGSTLIDAIKAWKGKNDKT